MLGKNLYLENETETVIQLFFLGSISLLLCCYFLKTNAIIFSGIGSTLKQDESELLQSVKLWINEISKEPLSLHCKEIPENEPTDISQTQSIFNLPEPDGIEGSLEDNGGQVNFNWQTLGLRLEALIYNGMVHGLFKLQDSIRRRMMVGVAFKNGIKNGSSCWIIEPDIVLKANCYQPFKYYPQNITIFEMNMKSVFFGSMDDSEPENQYLIGQDVNLVYAQKQTCLMETTVKTIEGALRYKYDIQTKERIHYEFHNTKDFCSHMQKPISLVEYMDNVEPKLDGDMDKESSKLLISNLEHIQDLIYQATFQVFEPTEITFEYVGKFDFDGGQFHGYGILKVQNVQQCFRGRCKRTEIQRISGIFKNGLLNGLVTIFENSKITYLPMKNGIVNGIAISKRITNGDSKLRQVIRFTNGQPSQTNPGWIVFSSNTKLKGYLYGTIGSNGKLSGNGAYIYPNAKVVLLGIFKNNRMVSAKKAFIKDMQCKSDQVYLSFTDPSGPELYLDKATNISMGNLPLAPDPYETMTIEVKPSSIPNAGQGLFAKRTIEENELVAFYNGLRIPAAQFQKHIQKCIEDIQGDDQTNLEKEQKCHKNALSTLHLIANPKEVFNVPPFWNDLNRYNATLAHYANNKLEPETNVKLGVIDHPRFGTITCLMAERTIEKGEEIFLDYSFDPKDPISRRLFPWYFVQ